MKKTLILLLIALCFANPVLWAADSPYRLKPGDTLEVRVTGHTDLTVVQTITPDGTVSLPMMGRTQASGKTFAELDGILKRGLSAYLKDPDVMVSLKPTSSPSSGPAPYFVTIHDLKTDTWEVHPVQTKDEVVAWAAGRSYDIIPVLGAPTAPPTSNLNTLVSGQTVLVHMGRTPDFWEEHWYKIVTAASIVVGIVVSLRH
ncbi:MAG: polysaccharide biosynthesis/export family protein [Candidatus Margulisiibacteriota bacterium]